MLINRENVHQSDLVLGAIYEGGPSLSDEPIHDLLGTQNMKGIRPKNDKDGRTVFIALHSNSNESEWPDFLDESAGTYTYFGDNRDNYKDLLDTDGNKALHRVFNGDLILRREECWFLPFLFFHQLQVLLRAR